MKKNHTASQRSVRMLQFAAFLRSCTFYTPIIALFFIKGGAALSTLILAQVLYSVITLVSELPTGIIADKIGHRTAVILGYLLGCIAILLALGIHGGIGALLMYAVFAVGDAFISGSEQAYLYAVSKAARQNYKHNYATLLGLQSLALAASALLAGIVLAVYGSGSYTMLVLLTGLMYAIAFAVSLVLQNDRWLVVRQRLNETSAVKVLTLSVSLARKNRVIRALLIMSVLTLSGEYFLYSVYQPYFQENNVPSLWMGLIITIGAVANFGAVKYMYHLEKYIAFEKIMLFIHLLTATGFLVLANIKHPVALIVCFIVMKGLFNSLNPITSDYIQSNTPEQVRATVLSGMSFTQSAVQIVIRIGFAFLIGKLGVAYGLNVQAAYLFAGSVLAFMYMRRCGCVGRIPAR